MAAVLLVLVIVNAACTGWLVGTVRGMKHAISAIATAQADAKTDAADGE